MILYIVKEIALDEPSVLPSLISYGYQSVPFGLGNTFYFFAEENNGIWEAGCMYKWDNDNWEKMRSFKDSDLP
jgi:hypothetical protein